MENPERRPRKDLLDSMVIRVAMNHRVVRFGYYATQVFIWAAVPALLVGAEVVDNDEISIGMLGSFGGTLALGLVASIVATSCCKRALRLPRSVLGRSSTPAANDPVEHSFWRRLWERIWHADPKTRVRYLASFWFSTAIAVAAHPIGALYSALWSSDAQRIWATSIGSHDWFESLELQLIFGGVTFILIRSRAQRRGWIEALRWANAAVYLAALGLIFSVVGVGLAVPLGDSPASTSMVAYLIFPAMVFAWSFGPFALATAQRGVDGAVPGAQSEQGNGEGISDLASTSPTEDVRSDAESERAESRDSATREQRSAYVMSARSISLVAFSLVVVSTTAAWLSQSRAEDLLISRQLFAEAYAHCRIKDWDQKEITDFWVSAPTANCPVPNSEMNVQIRETKALCHGQPAVALRVTAIRDDGRRWRVGLLSDPELPVIRKQRWFWLRWLQIAAPRLLAAPEISALASPSGLTCAGAIPARYVAESSDDDDGSAPRSIAQDILEEFGAHEQKWAEALSVILSRNELELGSNSSRDSISATRRIEVASSEQLQRFSRARDTHEKIESLLVHQPVIVPILNIKLNGLLPLWIMNGTTLLLLILIRNRLRQATELGEEASLVPWIVLDGRKGLERFMAHSWAYLLFVGPMVSTALLVSAQAAEVAATGAEPGAIERWAGGLSLGLLISAMSIATSTVLFRIFDYRFRVRPNSMGEVGRAIAGRTQPPAPPAPEIAAGSNAAGSSTSEPEPPSPETRQHKSLLTKPGMARWLFGWTTIAVGLPVLLSTNNLDSRFDAEVERNLNLLFESGDPAAVGEIVVEADSDISLGLRRSHATIGPIIVRFKDDSLANPVLFKISKIRIEWDEFDHTAFPTLLSFPGVGFGETGLRVIVDPRCPSGTPSPGFSQPTKDKLNAVAERLAHPIDGFDDKLPLQFKFFDLLREPDGSPGGSNRLFRRIRGSEIRKLAAQAVEITLQKCSSGNADVAAGPPGPADASTKDDQSEASSVIEYGVERNGNRRSDKLSGGNSSNE